jgi:hypothetical protein
MPRYYASLLWGLLDILIFLDSILWILNLNCILEVQWETTFAQLRRNQSESTENQKAAKGLSAILLRLTIARTIFSELIIQIQTQRPPEIMLANNSRILWSTGWSKSIQWSTQPTNPGRSRRRLPGRWWRRLEAWVGPSPLGINTFGVRWINTIKQFWIDLPDFLEDFVALAI